MEARKPKVKVLISSTGLPCCGYAVVIRGRAKEPVRASEDHICFDKKCTVVVMILIHCEVHDMTGSPLKGPHPTLQTESPPHCNTGN